MTGYLVDTTALIDFSKGHEPARANIQRRIDQGETLALCAVSVAEFYAGIGPYTHPELDAFVMALDYWDISPSVAIQAGRLRYTAARAGRVLSTTDTLIAALAVHRDVVVLTDNIKGYQGIPGLTVVSPRDVPRETK